MKTRRRFPLPAALAAVACLFAGAVAAAPDWLIVTADAGIRAGETLAVDVVRPEPAPPWPDSLRLRLQPGDGGEAFVVVLEAQPSPAVAVRRRYAARLPMVGAGLLRAGLADRTSNRLALIVEPGAGDDAIARMTADDAARPPPAGQPQFDPLPENEPALSANEPTYFVVGARDGLDARFQLSFKYRLFDPRSLPARLAPALGLLHFGYTQTSLWDLHGDSKPFRDTSYRPSLFWQGRLGDAGGGLLPGYLRGGYEHESNGRDGARSRSIDTLFLQPAWRKDFADGRTLFLAPKFLVYLDREDNPDIARYRGHVDWLLRYGDENGWLLAARLRHGGAGRGSAQLDLSHPLRAPLFSRVGGFLHVQLFSGYGETLLDYDVKRPPQLRLGFSIVR